MVVEFALVADSDYFGTTALFDALCQALNDYNNECDLEQAQTILRISHRRDILVAFDTGATATDVAQAVSTAASRPGAVVGFSVSLDDDVSDAESVVSDFMTADV